MPASRQYLLKILLRPCSPPNREVGDVAGGGVTNIRTDDRQNLDGVGGAHDLAATRRDAAIHQIAVAPECLGCRLLVFGRLDYALLLDEVAGGPFIRLAVMCESGVKARFNTIRRETNGISQKTLSQ